jgi:hypothetical protein
MPIPLRVGQWNKVGLNRLTRHIAPWMPGFGVVVHRGRRSGRRYRTPVNVFPAAGGYLIALTRTGSRTSWPRAAASWRPGGAPSGSCHRACITMRPGAACARPNGRYCGLSVLPTSWLSRRPREAPAPAPPPQLITADHEFGVSAAPPATAFHMATTAPARFLHSCRLAWS